MSERVTVSDIKAMALAQLDRLADHIAPDMAWRDGFRRWSLNPTRADTSPGSFVIDMSGPTAGRFAEFAAGPGCNGDLIDLVSYCEITRGGPGFKSVDARGKAIRWLKDWLGIAQLDDATRAAMEKARAQAAERARRSEHEAKEIREAKARKAKDDWLAAAPWPGSLVETYLTKARGLPVREIGSPLNAIRFEAEGFDPATGEIMPVMIAAMTGPKGEIAGVHRTYLREDGLGKADISPAKRTFGNMKGAAVRLTRGKTGLSEGDASAKGVRDDVLAIAEGIENALAWAFLEPDMRTWAAANVGNIGLVPIPDCVGTILILADNDLPDSPAADGLAQAAARLRQRGAGRIVRIQRPASAFKDFNDMWRGV